MPLPTPGPADGKLGTPLGSPRVNSANGGRVASWGATTVGSTTRIGSRFFAGSGSGGTSCLSLGLGGLPTDGSVNSCFPPAATAARLVIDRSDKKTRRVKCHIDDALRQRF